MAQKRFFNWQDDINSYEFGELNLGQTVPGRYAGFDTMADALGGGINVDISHSATGISKTTEAGSRVNDIAVAILPNGTILHEDATVGAFTLSSNAGNGNTRYDLLIAEHTYTQVAGGSAVSYSIIEGDTAGNVPTVATPASQIILGTFEIAPNGTTVGDTTYTASDVPLIGGESAQSFLDKLDLKTKTSTDADIQAEADARVAADTALQDQITQINSVPQGLISMWSGAIGNIPAGWVLCDGANGTPDLKGRFIVGYDNTPGENAYDTIGNTGGSATVALTVSELPAHTHTEVSRGFVGGGSGGYVSSSSTSVTVNTNSSGSTGDNQPHENRPPYYTLAYIMKT